MSNLYWPVYKNLEKEITTLAYSIHIDDHQLSVYSSNISDLILRASAEIESISKELYKRNGGTKTQKIKYDTDALELLIPLWKLDQKVVLISSLNCFQSVKELKPFVKLERSTFHGRETFSWNNSYQNLKHDRANAIHFGCLKYLFDIMAALFILNLYYKDEVFQLEKDSKATTFPINMGSELFAIKLHKWGSYNSDGTFQKKEDFDECIYLTKYTEESINNNKEANEELRKNQLELLSQHPKFLEYIKHNDVLEYKGKNLMLDVLGQTEFLNLIRPSIRKQVEVLNNSKYEAVMNKNNF